MKKIEYISTLKVFAIFLVVLAHLIHHFGHSEINHSIHLVIYSFHMPLFAFISGYLLSNKRGLLKGIWNKIMRLGIPLAFWCCVCVFVKTGYDVFYGSEDFHFMAFVRNIYHSIMVWELWYLRAILISFVVSLVTMNVCSNKVLSLLSSVVIVQLLSFVGFFSSDEPLIEMNGFVFLYPFLCSGVIFREIEKNLLPQRNLLLFFSLLIFVLSLYFWEIQYTFYHTKLCVFSDDYSSILWNLVGITFFRFVIGLFGTLSFFLLFQVYARSKYIRLRFFERLADAVMCIYIVHFLLLNKGFLPEFHDVEGLYAVGSVFLYTLIVFFACYVVYNVTSKNKYAKLLMWGEGMIVSK